MIDFVIKHEANIRVCIFAGMLLIIALWEWRRPRRRLLSRRLSRWTRNFSLVVASTLLIKLVLPIAAVALALKLQSLGWGLFNILAWPSAIEIIITIVLMDAWIYWQHRLMHIIPWFWRLHRLHHTDLDYDLSTAVRFHPVEILFSMLIKMLAITILGGPAIAVFIYEIILSSAAIFNHANAKIPARLEQKLRRFIVTPDFHRIHHSTIRQETDSNYGNFLSLWDHLFRSYTSQPKHDHESMLLGLDEFRSVKEQSFLHLLVQPVRNVSQSQAKDPDDNSDDNHD